MQNLDEYRRIKASALGADGIMDEDFNHMMETTSEQFKLLKINMKELVFLHLHKTIEKINEILTKINKNPVIQKGIFTTIVGTVGFGILLTFAGTLTIAAGKIVGAYGKLLDGIKYGITDILSFFNLKLTSHRFLNGKGRVFQGL